MLDSLSVYFLGHTNLSKPISHSVCFEGIKAYRSFWRWSPLCLNRLVLGEYPNGLKPPFPFILEKNILQISVLAEEGFPKLRSYFVADGF